jgi:hypothetical protein
VLATRGEKRHRECFNEHRFWTEERVVPQGRRAAGMAPLLSRDKQMLVMWNKGYSMTRIGKAFGLATHSQVSRALKRLGVVGARAHGQLARWRGQAEMFP